MNNLGSEQYTPPNGYRDPSASKSESTSSYSSPATGSQSTTGTSSTSSTSSTSGKGTEGSKGQATTLNQMFSFAKEFQSKVKDIPYIVPITFGATGFVFGVLASSRILRSALFLGTSYAMKYAIANAPKDQILEFAKKTVMEAIRAQRV